MNQAGGPFSNYVLQATVALARQLRARGGPGWSPASPGS